MPWTSCQPSASKSFLRCCCLNVIFAMFFSVGFVNFRDLLLWDYIYLVFMFWLH
ncbi:hypothetical protein Hanom_Chr00s110382g01807461 [Helianthus anomalus]